MDTDRATAYAVVYRPQADGTWRAELVDDPAVGVTGPDLETVKVKIASEARTHFRAAKKADPSTLKRPCVVGYVHPDALLALHYEISDRATSGILGQAALCPRHRYGAIHWRGRGILELTSDGPTEWRAVMAGVDSTSVHDDGSSAAKLLFPLEADRAGVTLKLVAKPDLEAVGRDDCFSELDAYLMARV